MAEWKKSRRLPSEGHTRHTHLWVKPLIQSFPGVKCSSNFLRILAKVRKSARLPWYKWTPSHTNMSEKSSPLSFQARLDFHTPSTILISTIVYNCFMFTSYISHHFKVGAYESCMWAWTTLEFSIFFWLSYIHSTLKAKSPESLSRNYLFSTVSVPSNAFFCDIAHMLPMEQMKQGRYHNISPKVTWH